MRELGEMKMIIALIVLALISAIISNWMAWLIVKKNNKIEELIGKLGELEESNRGQYGLLTQYEEDIIKLEDDKKSYKKVLGNLQEEVDVLIDEKREVEGKTKELKKQLEDENFNLSTITNALGRVIGDKKSTDLARENSNHFEFILKAIHEIEKKEKTKFQFGDRVEGYNGDIFHIECIKKQGSIFLYTSDETDIFHKEHDLKIDE